MSNFTDVRDKTVAFFKANPTVGIALVAFVLGWILGKM